MFSLVIEKDFYIIYYNKKKLCKFSKINRLDKVLAFVGIKDYKII